MFKEKLSDVFLLALISAISYYATYIYQLSYFDHYNIPSFFIELDNTRIVMTAFSIGFSLFLILSVIDGITSFIPNSISEVAFKIIRKYIAYVLFFIFIAVLAGGLSRQFTYVYSGVLVLMLIVDLFVPCFKYKEGRWKEKVIRFKVEKSNNEAKNTDSNKYTLFSWINKRIPNFSIYLVLTIFLTFICMGIGDYMARKQTSFLLNQEKTYIVLGIFQDKYIVKDIDYQNRIVKNRTYLIPHDKEIILYEETIGKMQVEKN